MKNKNITICNEIIHPGESLSLALPLPELFSCSPMYMPIKVIHGKQEGPCLLVTAAMHGNELNGTEVVHQLLHSPLMEQLCGTLIAVPVMNVYGFVHKARTWSGNAEINQRFPGKKNGSNADRLAYLFTEEIFSLADYCIDLQTGKLNYSNLPQIFIGENQPIEKKLADVFSAPVISQIVAQHGSLREVAQQHETPYLVYEAGEAMRFDQQAISVGVDGVINIMRELSMLSQDSSTELLDGKKQDAFMVRESQWIRSPTSGISHPHIQLGQRVAKGDLLSVIKDPFGTGHNVEVNSPLEGIVMSMNNLPLVHEGVELCQIASFVKAEKAASHIESWVEQEADQA